MARKKNHPSPPKTTRRPASGRRVLAVLGADSFLGSEFLADLEQDRRYEKLLAVGTRKPAFPLTKTQFHLLDVTLPTADAELAHILEREGVDTFVHAAFLSAPTHRSEWAHELETIGTLHALSACGQAAIRKFVLLSSTLVYGASPLHPNFLGEDHPIANHSRSRFIRDKQAAEREVLDFAKENRQTVVTLLRLAHTLGPRVRNYATQFLGLPVCPTLMGFDPLLQFLHEDDALSALKLACNQDHPGCFNIVGDGVLPYRTVLALMGKVPLPLPHVLAYPIAEVLWASELSDLAPGFLDFLRFLCVADGAKAKQVMGFHPRYDIKATIMAFHGIADSSRELPAHGGAMP